MKRLLFALVCCASGIGCGTSQVQIALNPARLADCKYIKTVEVYDPLGPKSLKAEARDVALKEGGNTILVGETESGFMTEKAAVEIYLCPTVPTAQASAAGK